MPGDAVDDVRSIVLENKGEGGFGIPDNDIEIAPLVIRKFHNLCDGGVTGILWISDLISNNCIPAS